MNESQTHNAPYVTACPKCGFMNFSNSDSCMRCRIGLSPSTDPASRFSGQRAKADLASRILNGADFLFLLMGVFGMYWFYFDHAGARTVAQKQFRMLTLIIGSIGMLVVWAIKLARKKGA